MEKQDILARLREHQAALKAQGVSHAALFGSRARGDARPDSDIDVLVTFAPEARWSLLDLPRMQDELSAILGRSADLVDIKGLRNPFRRREILATKEVVYAS